LDEFDVPVDNQVAEAPSPAIMNINEDLASWWRRFFARHVFD
jgi:hypothetical protein